MALGIFSFVMLAILGLLPTLLGHSQNAWEETRATQIARQIFADLTPTPDRGPRIVEGDGGEALRVTAMDTLPSAPLTLVFDMDGTPTGEGSPDALFEAVVEVRPEEQRDGLFWVGIDVRNRNGGRSAEPYRFISRIALSERDGSPMSP